MRVRRGMRGLVVGLGVLVAGAASAVAAGLGEAGRWWALSAAGAGGVVAAFVPSVVSAVLDRQREQVAARAALEAASGPVEPSTEVSPATLLRPERGVVAFRGRQRELAELRAWCARDGRPVRLLVGAGGVGKTRLARRLAEELAHEGWECRFVRQDRDAEVVDLATRVARRPLLLVVDYAETAAGLSSMLEAVTRAPDGARVRVLLLARGIGEWWDRLEASTFQLREALAPSLVLPSGFGDGLALEEVVRESLRDFGRALHVVPPSQVEIVMTQDAPPVLVVHAAVLVALLGAQDTVREPMRVVVELGVLDELLRHEAVYWQRSAGPAGLAELDSTTRRRVVALACVADVPDEEEAALLLTAVPDLRDSPEAVRRKTARWLRQLYEPASPGSWFGSLQPDLLAERHVVDQFAACPELADACVAGGAARRPLAILARAMDHHDSAVAVTERLVTQHPAVVAAAIEVALSIGERLAGLLTRVLPGLSMPVEDLERADAALPASTVLLAEAAVLLARRVLEALPADADPLTAVSRRGQLSQRLAQVGRSAEALAYNWEAVEICRERAALDPAGFGPVLATSVNELSVRLSEVGRTDEALPLGQEAVRLLRATNRHDQDHLRSLAAALMNLGVWLWQAGRAREAVPLTGEAVLLYEDLVDTAGGQFVPEWAAALDNLGVQLLAIGQLDEALRRSTLAVTLRRRLADASPDQFAPQAARTMISHGIILLYVGRTEEARDALREAVAMLRGLDRRHPGRFGQPLLRALHALLEVGGLDPEEEETAERERLALSGEPTPPEPGAALGPVPRRDGLLERSPRHEQAGSPNADAAARATQALRDGQDLEARGLLAEAQERYAQADRLGSGEGAARLGVLLYERGEVDGAEAVLRRADERRHPLGTFRLGFLLQSAGRTDEAIAVYRRAAALGHTWAMNNLAALLEERGDTAGAWAMNERIIADGTDSDEVAKARRRVTGLGGVELRG
jgi:tetratricopeptide (TPR) repeat protein